MIRTISINDAHSMDMLQEQRDHSEPPEYWDDYRKYDPEPEEDDKTTQAEQLARIEEQNRRIEEMLGRVLGVLLPDEQVQEERAFIESLEGMTTEEMVAANRQRNDNGNRTPGSFGGPR